MGRLLSIKSAAGLLDLTPSGLYMRINRRSIDLPFIRIGGSIRIPESALNKWIEDQLIKQQNESEVNDEEQK